MATYPGIAITTASPQAQRGMEHTPSDPMQGKADEPQNSAQLSEEDQQRLIALVRSYKDQWSQDRVVLMQRCLQNLEFFKGNQFISFGPGEAEFFNAVDWMNQGDHAQDADDKDLYQYCNNFYQMLATGFVAALAPQVPNSKWMPEDAEQLADVTTAKAAQTLIEHYRAAEQRAVPAQATVAVSVHHGRRVPAYTLCGGWRTRRHHARTSLQ